VNEHGIAPPFDEWIGRERVVEDTITLERARKLAATLDRDPGGVSEGSVLPRGWHWIYFHEPIGRSNLGDEGHERLGDFLPPALLPRRMWAGGRLNFSRALRIGAEVRRVSTIRSIEQKQGRSGPLVFVMVEHRVHDDAGLALVEEQDIVYLDRRVPGASEAQASGAPSVASAEAERTEYFVADEVALFRFSALTFNGHRIHYDRRYSREVEHYPDIVVHGPLLALLLLDVGLRHVEDRAGPVDPEAQVRYGYRAFQPVFCNEEVELCARGVDPAGGMGAAELWAASVRGVTTRAELVVSDSSRDHLSG